MDEIASESETSKGGVYFHFPNKQAIFLTLLDRTTSLLLARAEEAIKSETDPVARLDAALTVVFRTFSSHRALTRLMLIESLGAGVEFKQKMLQIHAMFEGLIQRHLDEAVADGTVAPMDTELAARAWYGALNHVVTTWALTDNSNDLETDYPALRALMLRSVGLQNSQPEGTER